MSNRTRKLPRGTWCRRLAWAVSLVFAGGILIQAGLAQPPPPPPPAPAPVPDREPVTESPRDGLPWLVEQNRRAREAKRQEDGHETSRRDRRYPSPIVQKVPDVAGFYDADGDSRVKIQQQGSTIRVLMGRPDGLTIFSGTYQNREFQGPGGIKSYRQCFFGDWELLNPSQGKFVTGVGAVYPHPSQGQAIVLDRWEQRGAEYVWLGSLQFARKADGEIPERDKTPPGPRGGSGTRPTTPPSSPDKTKLPGVDQLGDGAGFQ